jgi:hypothetical protein
VESGGPLVGKVGEWAMESQHLQGCSPRVSVKNWWIGLYEQVLDILIVCWYMGPVIQCNCVTTSAKPLSPTPRLSWGRKNEVTQDDGWASLFLDTRILLGVGADLAGTTWKVAMHWPREIRMVWDHTRTERGMHVVCWSGFPCQVYIDLNHRESRIWVTAYLWPSAHR